MEPEIRGLELCRMAIAKGNEENSDWINTVVGLYYKFNTKPNPRCRCYSSDRLESGRYSILAIIEDLLANFINSGSMPETDFDLPIGFTKEARMKFDAYAKELKE